MNGFKKKLNLSDWHRLHDSVIGGLLPSPSQIFLPPSESIYGNGGSKMDETRWVKHNSNECPIPWAKVGEFEIRDILDINRNWGTYCDANSLCWVSGLSFRLTDDWIYVIGDGTIPEAIRGAKVGEWEMRRRNGFKGTPPVKPDFYKFYWLHSGFPCDIVAVRLVKNEQDHHIRLAEAELKTASSEAGKPETEKQRLTREAWERYKAKHPNPIPTNSIGECAMIEIAAKTLDAFDAELERKRG